MAIVVRPEAELLQRPGEPHLGEGVDRRRGLVEHQHIGVDQGGADKSDQLPLAGRQLGAPLADLGVEPVGQGVEPIAQVEVIDRRIEVTKADLGPGEGEVGGDAALEQEGLLGHQREPFRRSSVRHPSKRYATDLTAPAVGSAMRAMSRPRVVLPEPVSPTMATCCPAGMWALTPTRTGGSSVSPRLR